MLKENELERREERIAKKMKNNLIRHSLFGNKVSARIEVHGSL